VIVDVPGATPVTSPVGATVATVSRELLHAMSALGTGWPAESVGNAWMVKWPPTAIVAAFGLKTILTTRATAAICSGEHAKVATATNKISMAREVLEIARMRPPGKNVRRLDWHGALARAVAS
jgi:hypothetical protein